MKIAIVEDSKEDSARLKSVLERFQKETSVPMELHFFSDAESFLFDYKKTFDLLFLDIMLPKENGMELAKKIRETDQETLICFITTMAQFVYEGYNVDAIDFIVKPVEYPSFYLKMSHILKRLNVQKENTVLIKTTDGIYNVKISDIRYCEIDDHRLIYHLVHGELSNFQPLSVLAKQLEKEGFARCNSCYLVNLRYVTDIEGFNCHLGNDVLLISHPKKKEFLKAFRNYTEKK